MKNGRISCDAKEWNEFRIYYQTALEKDGWIRVTPGSQDGYNATRLTYAKDNQLLSFYVYSIDYHTGDEAPNGSVTRAEALPLIQTAIAAQPYYIGTGEIKDEPRAEVLLETYIPGVFGKAGIQIFQAYGRGSYNDYGDLGLFLVSNGTALRIYDWIENSFHADIDGDGIYEFLTMTEGYPNDEIVEARAYKYGIPPGEDSPRIHLAYETFLDLVGVFDNYDLSNLQLVQAEDGQIYVYGTHWNVIYLERFVENLGLLLFRDGELFPEKMEEFGITFGGEEYFYNPFNPPADWLVTPSPPPAP
ncbi:MAG: hypothetical protein LBR85_03450 [Oscillospiraceae bacterium]|nr:hypothetical protein [Oscillospiraceae bacterium]